MEISALFNYKHITFLSIHCSLGSKWLVWNNDWFIATLYAAALASRSGLFEQENLKTCKACLPWSWNRLLLDWYRVKMKNAEYCNVVLAPLYVVLDESSLCQSGVKALPTETGAADSTVPTPADRYTTCCRLQDLKHCHLKWLWTLWTVSIIMLQLVTEVSN